MTDIERELRQAVYLRIDRAPSPPTIGDLDYRALPSIVHRPGRRMALLVVTIVAIAAVGVTMLARSGGNHAVQATAADPPVATADRIPDLATIVNRVQAIAIQNGDSKPTKALIAPIAATALEADVSGGGDLYLIDLQGEFTCGATCFGMAGSSKGRELSIVWASHQQAVVAFSIGAPVAPYDPSTAYLLPLDSGSGR